MTTVFRHNLFFAQLHYSSVNVLFENKSAFRPIYIILMVHKLAELFPFNRIFKYQPSESVPAIFHYH
jgi:hypothetical protein